MRPIPPTYLALLALAVGLAGADVLGLLPSAVAQERVARAFAVHDFVWAWTPSDPAGDGYIADKRPDGTDQQPPETIIAAGPETALSCANDETYDLLVRGYRGDPAAPSALSPASEPSDLIACERDLDLTGDGIVGAPDFLRLVAGWGSTYGIADFVVLSIHFGQRVCGGEYLLECPPGQPQRSSASPDPASVRLALR